MHIAIIAGEASGDTLGAELMKALRRIDPTIRFDGVGGPKMIEQGFYSMFDIKQFSVMGLTEILKSLPRLLSFRRKILNNYQASMPDIFIGIDYPEFNLSLEKKLKELGVFTVHYVSPSVWAWREGRIKHIKESCELMLTLFDFEKSFYDINDLPAVYCGHPLSDTLPKVTKTSKVEAQKSLKIISKNIKYLAVLPGSRVSEVTKMLPVFIETAQKLSKKIKNLAILIPAINLDIHSLITKMMKSSGLRFKVLNQQATEVVLASDVVLLSSGTATFEAMLLEKPMLVSYKVSKLTAMIAKRLVNTEFFSLPNLLANRQVVPEYMQDDINTQIMADDLYNMIFDENYRSKMIDDLIDIKKRTKKNGANIAAQAIFDKFSRQSFI